MNSYNIKILTTDFYHLNNNKIAFIKYVLFDETN